MSYIKYKVDLFHPSHLSEKSIDAKEHIRYMVSYLCLGIICILTAYITSAVATARQQKNQEQHLLERLNTSHANDNINKQTYSYPLLKKMHGAQVNRRNFPVKLKTLFSKFERPLDLRNIKYQNDSLHLEGRFNGNPKYFKQQLEASIESLMKWPQFSYRFKAPVVLAPESKMQATGDVSQQFKLIAVGK